MVKQVTASSNWENVNRAKEAFNTNDKILIRILKFVPNVFKLIAAFFIDYLHMLEGYFSKNKSEIKPQNTSTKIKNFLINHKKKIFFIMGALGCYFLIPRAISFISPNPITISEMKQKIEKEYNETIYAKKRGIDKRLSGERNISPLFCEWQDDGTKKCTMYSKGSLIANEQGTKNLVARLFENIFTEIYSSNGTSLSNTTQTLYQENYNGTTWTRII